MTDITEIALIVVDTYGGSQFVFGSAYRDLDEAARVCADLNAKTYDKPYHCEYIQLK